MKKTVKVLLVFLLVFATCFATLSVQASDSKRSIINSAKLSDPVWTGYSCVDKQIKTIFKEILEPDMDTYQQVTACYNYLIKNFYYAYNTSSASSLPSGKKEGYDCPYTSTHVGTVYSFLKDGYGMCNHFNTTFMVMMRALGLKSYIVTGGSIWASGKVTTHVWAEIKIDDTYYSFDPQIENMMASHGNRTPYSYFCLTKSAATNKYTWNNTSHASRKIIGN